MCNLERGLRGLRQQQDCKPKVLVFLGTETEETQDRESDQSANDAVDVVVNKDDLPGDLAVAQFGLNQACLACEVSRLERAAAHEAGPDLRLPDADGDVQSARSWSFLSSQGLGQRKLVELDQEIRLNGGRHMAACAGEMAVYINLVAGYDRCQHQGERFGLRWKPDR